MREMRYFKKVDQDYHANWENGIFILGNDDEILDHSISKRVIGKAKTYVVSGSHRLNRESYERQFLTEVAALINDVCNPF